MDESPADYESSGGPSGSGGGATTPGQVTAPAEENRAAPKASRRKRRKVRWTHRKSHRRVRRHGGVDEDNDPGIVVEIDVSASSLQPFLSERDP